MRPIKASEGIFDYKIYPRGEIDKETVDIMLQALQSGVKFPPPLIDSKSLRIIDGFHRFKMYQSVDPAAPIEIIEREYSSDAEMFSHAIKLNSSHGKTLSLQDRTLCIRKGAFLGLSVGTLASALSMTIECVGNLYVVPACKKSTTSVLARKRQTRNVNHLSDAEHAQCPNGKINSARAMQVMSDIGGSLQALESECERLDFLIEEARDGKYWKIYDMSEASWGLSIVTYCTRINNSMGRWSKNRSKGNMDESGRYRIFSKTKGEIVDECPEDLRARDFPNA
jgi:hypothetical protein